MKKREESGDRLVVGDYKRYLACCTFVMVGLSLFHSGVTWLGWGVMVASWAAWVAAIAASFRRDVLKGGE